MKLEELTQEGLDTLTSQMDTEKQARADAETKLAGVNGTITEKDSRIIELEQTVAGKESEITTLKATLTQGEETLTTVNGNLSQAIAAYKVVVAQGNPAVPGELITGDTIGSINQSLESAKTLISKVRAGIEAEIASGKVPAGAPARSAPDLESLSPREKIQYAITKGGKR